MNVLLDLDIRKWRVKRTGGEYLPLPTPLHQIRHPLGGEQVCRQRRGIEMATVDVMEGKKKHKIIETGRELNR
jgi:hypothetical protein